MLRSGIGPEKISEKPDPLKDLSSKHGYINAATSILCDLLFTTISVFDSYHLAGFLHLSSSKVLRNYVFLLGGYRHSKKHCVKCLHRLFY